MWPFKKRRIEATEPPADFSLITEADRTELLSVLMREQVEVHGGDRAEYRVTRHAYEGARKCLTDLVASYVPLDAALRRVTNLDPAAIKMEAAAMLDRLNEGEEAGMSEHQRLALAENIASFVVVTNYAGVLRERIFTPDWQRTYEQNVMDRYPPQFIPGIGAVDAESED